MINWPLVIFGSLCFLNLNAQSGKQVRTYGIKSVTETVITYKDGEEKANYVAFKEFFDKRGEWIERTTYNKDGTIDKRITRKYDGPAVIEETEEEGAQKEKKGHDGDYKREVYVYHKGDMTEKHRYDRDGNLEWKEVYTYNKYGDKVREERITGGDKLEEVELFTFDSKGLKTAKTTSDAEGIIIEKRTYSYEIR